MTSVADTIAGVLALEPATAALEYQSAWITWGDLDTLVRQIDSQISAAELGAGTRVGILLRNRPPQLAAALAVIVSNRCLVTLNPVLPDERLVDDLATLQLPIVIAERADLERPGVLDALQRSGSAVLLLDNEMGRAPCLLPGSERPRGSAIRRDQPGVIIEMLSSGTTGKPKRIPLSITAFERGFAAGNAYEKGRTDDRPRLRSGVNFLSLPFTHISGLWAAVQWIASGRKACLMERFVLQDWRGAVLRHRPKLMSGPPTMLKMVLDADLPKADLASILAIRTGTAPLDPAIADAFFERYNIPVLSLYGATEFAGAVSGWTIEDFHRYRQTKRGSVGRLQPGIEARIVDINSFEPLPAGEEGLLELRGSQLGELVNWQRTTDRAVLDADGFLFIRGRADNAILRGGFKIHPDDVAKAIESHPAIHEACVVGLADERLGQVPVAAIVISEGAIAPSVDELSTYLRTRLTGYQIPTQFKFVTDLPRTPSMKVSQPDVRALFNAEGA